MKMNMKAMLALLGLAERLEEEHKVLSMGHWLRHKGPRHHKGPPKLNHCGTSGCFLGSAAIDPMVKDITGLSVQEDKSSSHRYAQHWDVVYTYPSGRKLYNFNAAEKVFGLTRDQAYHLFGGAKSGVPGNLRKRVIEVIAQGTFPERPYKLLSK